MIQTVVVLALVSLAATAPAWAATPSTTLVRRISWSQLESSKELRAGTIVRRDVTVGGLPGEVLRLENASSKPQRFVIAVLDQPGIERKAWAVRGLVRYEAVEGEGFLELWSTLPGGGEYFSRTLAPQGPLAVLSGDSDWRAFALPFQAETDAQRPDRLTLALILPGRGTVEIGPLELHQGSDAMKLAGISGGLDDAGGANGGPWWNDQAAGRIGAGLGMVIGVLGALIGVFASRGRARGLVEGLLVVATVAGAALLLAGVFALGSRQPSEVRNPLLLAGALLSLLAPLLLRVVKRRYREFELRRISALDMVR